MGIVFYELATLHYPYIVKSSNSLDYMDAHRFGHMINPKKINQDIPDTIVLLITRMLNKKSRERFNDWNEIIDILISEKITPTQDNSLIARLLSDRIKKDTKKAEYEALTIQREEERSTILKLTEYQIDTDIYAPLNTLINEFNSKYPQGKMQLQKGSIYQERHLGLNVSQRISYEILISLDNEKHIRIEISPMFSEDYIRVYEKRDRPLHLDANKKKIFDRKILAWGGINYEGKDIFGTKGKLGFNLVLLENKDDVYGEWFIIENYNDKKIMNNKLKGVSVAFSLDELEDDALKWVGFQMGPYEHKVIPFSFEYLLNVIDELGG